MIRIGRVCDLQDNEMCENWMIVRSPDEHLSYGRLVTPLSPSDDLFRTYRKAYHDGLYDQNFFRNIYVPRFLKDLSENEEALGLLSWLYLDGKTKDYFLTCYCENEAMCHRSIIAGILIGMGADIEADPVYKKYYDMFLDYQKNRIV